MWVSLISGLPVLERRAAPSQEAVATCVPGENTTAVESARSLSSCPHEAMHDVPDRRALKEQRPRHPHAFRRRHSVFGYFGYDRPRC